MTQAFEIPTSNLLTGKEPAELLTEKLRDRAKGIGPVSLAVLQVGDNPASSSYINRKSIAAKKVGIGFEHAKLNGNVGVNEISDAIHTLNNSAHSGIILQLPLPEGLNDRSTELELLSLISPKKDADGLTPENVGLFQSKRPRVIPATALSVLEMLKFYEVGIEGNRFCVVGDGITAGSHISRALLNEGGSVFAIDRFDKNQKEVMQFVDIVITAVGKPHLFNEEFFRDEQVIIDVGISRVGKELRGDVDYRSVLEAFPNIKISPVPGGPGQLTPYTLMSNTLDLAEMR